MGQFGQLTKGNALLAYRVSSLTQQLHQLHAEIATSHVLNAHPLTHVQLVHSLNIRSRMELVLIFAL